MACTLCRLDDTAPPSLENPIAHFHGLGHAIDHLVKEMAHIGLHAAPHAGDSLGKSLHHAGVYVQDRCCNILLAFFHALGNAQAYVHAHIVTE